jgi:hypothetical protein
VDQLVLAAGKSPDWAALAEALSTPPLAIEGVRERLMAQKDAKAVLPTRSLAFYINLHEQNSRQALLSWLEDAQAVVDLSREFRGRTLVISEDDVALALVNARASVTAWAAQQPLPELSGSAPALPSYEALAEQLAINAVVASDAAARQTQEELSALTLPLVQHPSVSTYTLADALFVLQTAVDTTSLQSARARSDALEQELAEVRLALSVAASDYADALEALKREEAGREEAAQHRAALEARLHRAEANAAAADQKQVEMESAHAAALSDKDNRIRDLEAQCRDLEAQCRFLESAVDETRSSTSWRVTAPLRAVKSVLKPVDRRSEDKD